ncbi:MAG: hypothetical protein KJ737_26840 [Proteobacteria bacterium]|nr:hypothetical protein [Pseudomonadota bacterium]
MEDNTYTIRYHFLFKNGKENTFDVKIDSSTMLNLLPQPENKPFWTELDYHQCECCPLDKAQVSHCPIALNIMGLIEAFKNVMSSEKCQVSCITPERTYSKEVDIQNGLFSIFGIINATSSCPIMSFFKPMAKFHLPFSTIEETKVRVISFYLLSQYFKQEKSDTIDIQLEQLESFYSKVELLDAGILNRIRGISDSDADKNAVIILNSIAQLISMEIDEQLQSIEDIFKTSGF